MAIKLRYMTEKDYDALGGTVRSESSTRSSVSVLDDRLDSEKLFGVRSHSLQYDSCETDNKRASIILQKPVFNMVLSDKCKLLADIIGGGFKYNINAIKNYTGVYDLDEQRIISTSKVPNGADYLIGAEIAEMCIKKFDIDMAIREELFLIINKALGLGIKVEEANKNDFEQRDLSDYIEEIGQIEYGAGKYDVFGGWNYQPHPEIEAALIAKGIGSIQLVIDEYLKTFFVRDTTRISYLVNIRGHKERLYGMLFYRIACLPKGMRPRNNKTDDKLTKGYNNITKANTQLITSDSRFNVAEYSSKLRDLQIAVNALVGGEKVDPVKYPKKYIRSVQERLQGKNGQIRKHNLGKRQDYSGRAVVTVNPFLPTDTIMLPEHIIAKIYKFHILKYMDKSKLRSVSARNSIATCMNIVKEHKLLEKIPAIFGRQPTLHKQSIQAFWVLPCGGDSIQVPPLVCPAFNMDFDGDQSYFTTPLSPAAIKETIDLVLTTNNIYLAKNGESTINPRLDMIYGLYTCTRDDYRPSGKSYSYNSYQAVKEDLVSGKIEVNDMISTHDGKTDMAGRIAVKACLPEQFSQEITELTNKSIKKITAELLTYKRDIFIKSVDNLSQLGFRIATLYPPTLTLLEDECDVPEYDNAINSYHENMSKIKYYYNLGMVDSNTYNLEQSKNYSLMEKKMVSNIETKLGRESGFYQLANSGARGDKRNLLQMFAYKGVVTMPGTSLNIFVENSYREGLSPLDHVVNGFGGRKGMMDKTLKTGATGYFERILWHAAGSWVLRSEDCGSQDGLLISKDALREYTTDSEDITKLFAQFIQGRYEAETDRYIDANAAKEMAKARKEVRIRSPLTCLNPCCRKCYGDDPSTHTEAVVGLAVGAIAAQSIGEPSSQQTMKQFQGGGIAGLKDVASNFERLEAYVEKKQLKGKPNYDPTAWATGKVTTRPDGIGYVKVLIDGTDGNCKLSSDVVLKEYVKKGEGLKLIKGDRDVSELIKYLGVEEAKRYIVLALFFLYRGECEIDLRHYEIIVASMSRHMILSTDRSDLYPGQNSTLLDLNKGPMNKTRSFETLISVKDSSPHSTHAIESIQMERLSTGLSRSCLFGFKDDLDHPIARMVLGLKPKAGTYYPDFAMKRKSEATEGKRGAFPQ